MKKSILLILLVCSLGQLRVEAATVKSVSSSVLATQCPKSENNAWLTPKGKIIAKSLTAVLCAGTTALGLKWAHGLHKQTFGGLGPMGIGPAYFCLGMKWASLGFSTITAFFSLKAAHSAYTQYKDLKESK